MPEPPQEHVTQCTLNDVSQWAVLSQNDLLTLQGWMSMSKAINDTPVFSAAA